MMKLEDVLSRLVFLAGLALFVGIGFLAWKIGETWDRATTQSLVSGLVAVCGGGAVVVGSLIALIVGVPLAMRYSLQGSQARRAGRDSDDWLENGPVIPAQRVRRLNAQGSYGAQSYNALHYNEWGVYQEPPRLLPKAMEQVGSWQSQGPHAYDLWEPDEDADGISPR